MSRLLLSLENVALGYAQAPILRAVSLRVDAGDSVAVIGPNGGGKSTLLRGMLGSLSPLEGKRVLAPGLRVGFVPQELNLDRDQPLTVRDVVAMGAWGRHGGSRPLLEALAEVGLTEFLHRRFSELSGGQRQRVLLARALVGDPELLLLDEPASAADVATADALHHRLAELNRNSTALVIVTHHPLAVRSIASRALTVGGGCVREIPVSELAA